jgi:hypothetical protein
VTPGPSTYNYTVSFYGEPGDDEMKIGLSDGVSNNIDIPGYRKNISTVTVNGETVTLGGIVGASGNIYYKVTPSFTTAPTAGDSAVFTL